MDDRDAPGHDNKTRALLRVTNGTCEAAHDPRAEVLLLNVAGDKSATLRLRWWSDSERGEYLVVRDRVLERVWQVLNAKTATM